MIRIPQTKYTELNNHVTRIGLSYNLVSGDLTIITYKSLYLLEVVRAKYIDVYPDSVTSELIVGKVDVVLALRTNFKIKDIRKYLNE